MNYYAEAIKIVTQADDKKCRLLLGKLLEKSPGVIIKANNKLLADLSDRQEEDWKNGARAFIKNNQFVHAIRHCRIATGWELKAAKAACEDLRSEMLWEESQR
jgi:hypothetical protein